MKKRTIALLTSAMVLAAGLTGCSNKNNGNFNKDHEITVVSREDGSGTRGAFIELFGIEQKDATGNKVDMTTDEANFTNSTAVMMTTVANDEYAVGYISLGSLNNSVKAVKIDGNEASVDNVKSGSYKVARPFNIVVMDNLSDNAQDFITYIMSADGQKIVEDNGYVPIENTSTYSGSDIKGKIVVAGSSSVSPLMDKLKEAYQAINGDIEIEIQTSDSTTGASSTAEGIADIGMCSRDLKESEVDLGLTTQVIAMDGIAVIVNNDNPTDEMTTEQVKNIYTGETTMWSNINE